MALFCTQVFDFKLSDEDMRLIESFNRNERFIIPTVIVSNSLLNQVILLH